MKRVGTTFTAKVTKGRMAWMDGTHLFPMEKPLATAAAIEAALRGFADCACKCLNCMHAQLRI